MRWRLVFDTEVARGTADGMQYIPAFLSSENVGTLQRQGRGYGGPGICCNRHGQSAAFRFRKTEEEQMDITQETIPEAENNWLPVDFDHREIFCDYKSGLIRGNDV